MGQTGASNTKSASDQKSKPFLGSFRGGRRRDASGGAGSLSRQLRTVIQLLWFCDSAGFYGEVGWNRGWDEHLGSLGFAQIVDPNKIYIYISIYICKWGLYGDTAYINPAIFQGTIRQRTVGSSAHFKENKPHLRCSH